eukprot:Seg2069.1 transcript_id=Seg2069.1/GoldUCD/mRNA.D3Y31 product="Histone-lysine N-methyltransferase SETD7" protein_id=Seg2069.1/GoldUCD/D3Y31
MDDSCSSNSGSESDEETYAGQRDENGLPHGRGTSTMSRGDRFEGKFVHGKKHGKGSFYFEGGCSLTATFKYDDLNGQGTYIYQDGSSLVAAYVEGDLEGPSEEYDSNGTLRSKGGYKGNVRHGFWHFWDEFGGHFFGIVDKRGELSGNDITYVYPDGVTALKGTFMNSKLVEAKLAVRCNRNGIESRFLIVSPEKTFKRDESTDKMLSVDPLLQDPFEQNRSYVDKSKIPSAGEGLFAKVDMLEDEVMAFYNGVRLDHKLVDARDWTFNSNTISLDDNTVIDVPEEFSNTSDYCASLGHKANHSFDPNAKYDLFDHPRFGRIKCIRTIRPVKGGEELTVEYGYDHNGLGPNNPDAPQWYKDQYERFNSVKDNHVK